MHIVLPPLLPAAQRITRDLLVDLSQTRSLKQAVDDIVEDILGYATEKDAYLKRRKWCLATIYSRSELAEHIEYHLARSGLTFAVKPEFISGAEEERHLAGIWEAWFGIGFGFGSIDAEYINWGDTVYEVTFNDEMAMLHFLDLYGSDSDREGWYRDSDGWHAVFVRHDIYSR